MATMPLIGQQFGEYRLMAVIGRGGMSVVYRADFTRVGNAVALKVLAPELSADDAFRTRFLQESRSAASLNHPNVIPIYDSGPIDDLLYIAMRYVSGADLRGVLRAKERLSPEVALPLIAQTGRALDAAHRAGLVHRDVKPGNILIEHAGEDEPDHVYLSDFGITKHALSISGLTTTGHFVGTLDYIAPEQIQGKPVDARTDIYSLGCVLYETVTGQVPFRKDVDAAVIWAHVEERPQVPSEVRPELPRALDDVILRALAKDPADRYASCHEFVAAARDAVGGAPRSRQIWASSPPPQDALATIAAEDPGPAPARRPAAEGAKVDAVRADSAEREGPMPDFSGDPPTPPIPAGDSSRGGGARRGWLWAGGLAVAVVVAAAAVVFALTSKAGGSKGSAKASDRKMAMGATTASTTSSMTSSAPSMTPLMKAAVGANKNSSSRGLIPPSTCTSHGSTVLVCKQPGQGVTEVRLQTFAHLKPLYAAYVNQFRSLNRTRFHTNFGNCTLGKTDGEVGWNHDSQHPRTFSLSQLESGRLSYDKAVGRVFCTFTPSGPFAIVWTDNINHLLGIVIGSPHDETWQWWHKIHHTLSLSGKGMSMS